MTCAGQTPGAVARAVLRAHGAAAEQLPGGFRSAGKLTRLVERQIARVGSDHERITYPLQESDVKMAAVASTARSAALGRLVRQGEYVKRVKRRGEAAGRHRSMRARTYGL